MIISNHRIYLYILIIVSAGNPLVNAATDQNWPGIFDPDLLLTLNIQIEPNDWDIIVNDVTFDIERPAMFWAEGEENNKLYVSVRRKSSAPIFPAFGTGGPKISLKIDINEYISQDWHGLIKLSLENGADNNVLSEGIACNLHRMASCSAGYGYDAWRANWVKLYVNGHYYGVYVNAEDLDKRFLQNRLLYVYHETWLYQYRGEYDFSLEVGWNDFPRSPTVNELCYRPFRNESDPALIPDVFCNPPDSSTLVQQLDALINMRGMLSMAAVDAFISNPDSLFSHERNGHFLDFSLADGRKRMYFPWDVDASNFQTYTDIYGNATDYQRLILGNPVFRKRYQQIMCDLLAGPFSEVNLMAFIDMIEPVLSQAVADDPYNKLDSNTIEGVTAEFDNIRQKLIARIANVKIQAGCPVCVDANLDGIGPVNFVDFSIFANNWQLTGISNNADIDNDGNVDIKDLRDIVLYWLSDCP